MGDIPSPFKIESPWPAACPCEAFDRELFFQRQTEKRKRQVICVVKIGIVDDEKEAREQLREAIERFGSEYHMEFEVLEFNSAVSYLSAKSSACDILYLDIDMPRMTGMELAEKIRKTDSEVVIIFCTNLERFALNGYSVSALGFLVKPVQWYSFHMYLDRALKAVQKRADRLGNVETGRIVVKDGPVSRVIDAADIKYVEVRQHYLLYSTKDKKTGEETVIKTRGSMQDAVGLLSPYGFVRCSSSFLVNLNCITAVSRLDLYIGQEVLPIGRAFKDSFTREFSKYLAKRGWGNPC